MSATGTQTTTFTAVDIRKVVNNFAADFSMMAQATGLRTRESVANCISDLKIFAEKGYLIRVTLILKNADGEKIRGAVYKVSESASGWTSERPGNNLWPKTPGGSLKVIGTLAQKWWEQTDADKQAFIDSNGLHSSWDLTDEDLSFTGMTRTQGQRYASNGYGWERDNYA